MSGQELQLNDNHRNSLLAGFRYIDQLLSESLVNLAPAEDGAIFGAVRADATPVQQKVIDALAARLRAKIRAALVACALPVRPPAIGALWALRSALLSIEIALEEMAPENLRGYGAIDDATASGFTALLADIRHALKELDAYVESGLGGDLAARIDRLDTTADEVALLRELERIVTAHGLVEFRPALGHLIDRLEHNWWTVAFVGRVSCGKSSLLNFLLSTAVLPSGVTPVTAVPIRIVPGAAATATVSFATEKSERVPADQLGNFASEQGNPGNRRHVTDILLELPTPRLPQETCFVDTPGLGSLATAGGAQTLAFLPRCDLGVLLLDAGSVPTTEDLSVAQALRENGADLLVVLSKADLLTPPDRDKAIAYAGTQLALALGGSVTVTPVSVAAGHKELAETWYATEIAPRQAQHRKLAAVALRRKIGALRDAVATALSAESSARPGPQEAAAAAHAVAEARAAIERARRELFDLPYTAVPAAEAVLADAANSLVACAERDFSTHLAALLGQSAAALGDKFTSLLLGVLKTTSDSLTAGGAGGDDCQLPPPEARPLFDPAGIVSAGSASTAWRRWPGTGLRRCILRRALQRELAVPLDEALRAHARALVSWGQHYIDDLDRLFGAQTAFIERRLGPRASTPKAVSDEARRDLELLRSWPSRREEAPV